MKGEGATQPGLSRWGEGPRLWEDPVAGPAAGFLGADPQSPSFLSEFGLGKETILWQTTNASSGTQKGKAAGGTSASEPGRH